MKKSTLMLVVAFLTGIGFTKAQTTILEEDFESGTMPAGWSQTTNATDGGWLFGTAGDLSSTSFTIPDHTEIVATNDDACNCDKSNDVLIMPAVDLSTYSNVYLSFDSYFFYGYYDAQENAYVQVSTDGGSNWTTVKTLAGAGAWTTQYVDLSAYAGNSSVTISFKYDDGGGWNFGWAMDNVKLYEPLAGPDISVTAVHIGKYDSAPAFVDCNYALPDWSLQVIGELFNKGTESINSFDLSWTDGTNTYNQSVSGVTIAPLTAYEIVADDPYVAQAGSHDVTLTFSNLNGGVIDPDETDNSGTFNVNAVTINPDKMYLAEERTGTWCGWCIRGIVFMDYMRATYPDEFVGIAVHNGDPMKNTVYDNGMNAYSNSFPTVITDRTNVIDPESLEQDFLSRAEIVPAVTLTASSSFSTTNNKLSVHVTGDFTQDLSGDYRFNAVFVEDSVHGTSTGYDQTNYYSIADYGDPGGPMEGFEDLPGSISHNDMYYMQVGRSFLSSPATFNGQASSLPATITSGDEYSYDFTYTVPTTYNINHSYVVVMVIDNATGEIMNTAKSSAITITTGIDNSPANASLFIYPNPASNLAIVNANIPQPVNVNLEVYNAIGQVMMSNNYGVISGTHDFSLNVANLSSGVYDVRVKAGDQIYSKKLVIGQ